jgi:anti-sigma factor RsiW
MEAKQEMEARLWAYLHGLADDAEKASIEKFLQTDPAWRSCHEQLVAEELSIRSLALDGPSMRFTRNVMEQVQALQVAPATRSYVNRKIVYGVGGFFLLLITATLAYIIPQLDFSQGVSGSLPVRLPAMDFDWNKYFNKTTLQVFVIIDAVAALFFLDRYLQRRKAQWQADKA